MNMHSLVSYIICMILLGMLKLTHSHGLQKMKLSSRLPTSSCVCEHEQTVEGTDLNCNNCLSVSDLNDEIQRLSGKYTISTMLIRNSILMYLPTTIFRWIRMKQLLIHNSTIMGLEGDETSTLQPSKEMFKYFDMENVVGVDSWRWSSFSDLLLESLKIQRCEMYSVNKDFGEISSKTLAYVALTTSKIDFIDDHAFSSFHKLYSLFMYKNNIHNLKRAMFPNPASKLRILDFGDNKLDSLPTDIFTNMPALTFINLENNMLHVLDAETYKGLMSHKKLHLNFEGNNIYCCSYLEWIFSAQGSIQLLGTCARPSRLSGKKINELQRKEIVNFDC